MAGDGLVRPLNAPPAAQLAPGVQPGVSSAVTLARYVIVFGVNDGVFVYSGPPAPGNKPVAWVSNSTVDPYGNTLASPGGVGSFDGISGWSQLASGLVLVGSSLLNLPFRIQLATGNGAAQFLSPRLNAGDTRCELDLIPSATPGLQTGAIDRLAAWAPGAAGTTVETWHAVTLLNSWANTAGFSTLQYRLVASPPNSVEIVGVINSTAATSTTVGTLSAGYRPANANGFAVGATANVPAGGAPQMRCDTSGNLTINGGAAPPSAVSYFVHGFISLDA